MMTLHVFDWAVIVAYLIFALVVGLALRKRASKNIEEYFLSGRTLPWWLAGTSMIATSFAADTPLVITGWVRDFGLWKNWLWWCYAMSGCVWIFLFAKWWRRSGLVTKAEIVELRYGGREAKILRGFLGCIHASVTNTIVLCWVLLAMSKILGVLFGVDKFVSVSLACVIAMSYSFLAGFWGVVITDFVQFIISIVGAVVLAVLCWNGVGGSEGIEQAVQSGVIAKETLSMFPEHGPGGFFDSSFWTTSLAAVAVYLGVSWWAVENVDGSGIAVQRISASRDERHGALSVLWFNVVHYALRPWPWIVVALASLIVLPSLELRVPETIEDGIIKEIHTEGDDPHILIESDHSQFVLSLEVEGSASDWKVEKIVVEEESPVKAGELLARSDSEIAYVVMLKRYLPIGLLGLVIASLFAAFMSTIDTHVNLAASFFVNDIYRRFLCPGKSDKNYVWAARFASVTVMALAAFLAWQADSISDLFLFFVAFLAGVGPVYIMRWLWWRVTATTEIVAILASGVSSTLITILNEKGLISWPEGPLTPGGVLAAEGRVCLVVLISTLAAFISIVLARKPDPRSLLVFYRKVRPAGAWGPVRALASDVTPDVTIAKALLGSFGALLMIYGMLFSIGGLILARGMEAWIWGGASVLGLLICRRVWISLPANDRPQRE